MKSSIRNINFQFEANCLKNSKGTIKQEINPKS